MLAFEDVMLDRWLWQSGLNLGRRDHRSGADPPSGARLSHGCKKYGETAATTREGWAAVFPDPARKTTTRALAFLLVESVAAREPQIADRG
jgi:hypothetical protein